MTDTQRKRDPRYTRTFGEKPNLGRRYVENGKVRIEWYEDGKKRSKTIGDNDAKTRREADDELKHLLGLAETQGEAEEGSRASGADEDREEECIVDLSWLADELRARADAILDVADQLAEAFERGMVRVLDALRHTDATDGGADEEADVEDAEVVEEIKDDDAAK